MSTESSSIWSALSNELSEVALTAARSVVQVHGRARPASGVVWAHERVLSTSHSVEWDDGVRVRREDGTVLPASVVGHDPASDLVLLNVAGLDRPALPPATGDARVGDLGLLIGRVWSGRQHARLVTITGATGPVQTAHGPRLDRVITLPLPPFAGFSGSALIGPGGTLVALATAGLMRGRALALPTHVLRPIAEAIEKHGSIRRGYLGVVTQPVRLPARQRGELGAEGGLVVLEVSPDSPADAAGLLVGDVLVGAGGGELAAPEDLLAQLGPERVGQALPLAVLRGTAHQAVTVTVGARVSPR